MNPESFAPLAAYVPTNEFLQPLVEEEMNDE
jgi:hypothetical protein